MPACPAIESHPSSTKPELDTSILAQGRILHHSRPEQIAADRVEMRPDGSLDFRHDQVVPIETPVPHPCIIHLLIDDSRADNEQYTDRKLPDHQPLSHKGRPGSPHAADWNSIPKSARMRIG